MARNYARVAFESIPGNEANAPVLSTFKHFGRLQSMKPDLNPKHIERDDELGNDGQPQAISIDGYEPAWSKKGRLYPQGLAADLALMLGNPVITAGNGVITDPDSVAIPVGAHRYVWTAPFGPTGVSPKTVQIDASYVEEGQFFKGKGAAAQDMAINIPAEGSADFEMSGPMLYLARQADPALTATPESVAIQPFKFKGADLTADLASAAAVTGLSLKANNPLEMVKSMAANSYFPDLMEYANEGVLTWTADIERRHLANADWDALLGATGFGLTVRLTSESIIASAYPYKLYIAFSNAQYTGNDIDELANGRRAGDKFSLKATTAGAASVTVTLVCATASLA